MDLEPKQDRLDKRIDRPGKNTKKAAVVKTQSLLKEGLSNSEVVKLTGVDKEVVGEIRKKMEDEGKLDVLAFKRRTAARLASFIEKAVGRLDAEVENIPPSQLMLPTAIAIDKFLNLSETAPVVQVKAELRISADEINKLLSPNIIDAETLPDTKKSE